MTLSPTVRASIRDALDRLEALAQSKNRETAAGASEAAGVLRLALQNDLGRAEGDLRRAVAMDPSRGGAWELLAALAFQAKGYLKVATVCQEWMKQADSVRGRLILAKAYEKLDRLDQAEEAIHAALKLQPDDFTANLGLAVLLLKRGEDPARMAEAGAQLRRTADLFQKSTPPGQLADYGVILGIYQALTGDPESGEQQLRRVLKYDPDHDGAIAALEVLRSGHLPAPTVPHSRPGSS